MSDRAGLDWLGRILGAPALPPRTSGDPRYTADEVKRVLRQTVPDARGRRVHDYAARLGATLDEAPVRQRFWGLEDYHRRLLRILTLYCRGWEPGAIAAELSLFSTAVGVERAIDTAALLIADSLNHQRAA